MTTLPTGPYVHVRAFTAKLGYRIPGYLPLVVRALYPQSDAHMRDLVLKWLRFWEPLATYPPRDRRNQTTRVYVEWTETVEDVTDALRTEAAR